MNDNILVVLGYYQAKAIKKILILSQFLFAMKNLIYKHTWKLVKVQVFSAFYSLTYKIELLLSNRIKVH